MKSLRYFEEKKQKEKNREEIVQIIHTIYLDFMQEKEKTIQPTILCTLPNHYYTYKNKILIVKDTVTL